MNMVDFPITIRTFRYFLEVQIRTAHFIQNAKSMTLDHVIKFFDGQQRKTIVFQRLLCQPMLILGAPHAMKTTKAVRNALRLSACANLATNERYKVSQHPRKLKFIPIISHQNISWRLNHIINKSYQCFQLPGNSQTVGQGMPS